MTLVPIVNMDNQIIGAFCCQTECFYVFVPGETPLEIIQVMRADLEKLFYLRKILAQNPQILLHAHKEC